jgi:hypothetical protein
MGDAERAGGVTGSAGAAGSDGVAASGAGTNVSTLRGVSAAVVSGAV